MIPYADSTTLLNLKDEIYAAAIYQVADALAAVLLDAHHPFTTEVVNKYMLTQRIEIPRLMFTPEFGFFPARRQASGSSC